MAQIQPETTVTFRQAQLLDQIIGETVMVRIANDDWEAPAVVMAMLDSQGNLTEDFSTACLVRVTGPIPSGWWALSDIRRIA